MKNSKLNKLGLERDYPKLLEIRPLKEVINRYLLRAFVTNNFNRVHTARSLKIAIRTVRPKLKELLKPYEY